ncbi:MAG TPA: serine hydrolase domain-containing protein, partial [Rhodanobacteraceae bacterium]|nr:serine hydrolase domain-containing protein [Rhodanobacteraceae bacterium]
MSRTPNRVLIALCAAFVLAATSPVSASAAARTAAHAKRTAHAAPAAPASKVLANNDAVASNAGIVARQFDRWLDGLESSSDVSGLAVAIVKDDKVLLERGVGYANASTREPVTANTVFRLASLSKAFATAMAALMVQDGVISWDTKISNVLPTFQLADVNASQKLTVADILSHRVGLPHNTYDRMLEADEPYEQLVTRLSEVPMACPVGDCYGYQNIAFSLIGDVTYAVTGDFYYHEVETRIFHPLGMETATYGRDALEGTKSWARPHRRAGRGWIPYTPNEAYYHVAPAAGVNASIRDMEQWLIAQMGGRPEVLSPAVLETLHTPVVATDRERTSTPWRRGRLLNAQYALGWRIYDYAGQTLIFHAGAVQGYRAMIAFLPKYRFGAVMLWNCESAAPSGLMPML